MTYRTVRNMVVVGVAALAIGGTPGRADIVVDLNIGGNYTGQGDLNYNYNSQGYLGGGGSLDTSYLNSAKLPYLYCIDIPDHVNVPAEYAKTLATDTGQVWLGSNTSSISTVNNAGAVAYLIDKYAAGATTRAEMGGLQGAIWKVIYGGLFVMNSGSNGYSDYLTYYNDVSNNGVGPLKTASVSSLLWFSPSKDSSISASHAPGTIYQALVTLNPSYHSGAVPEPATIVTSSMGIVVLAGLRMWRRRRPAAA
ncbi:hypothetical protein [Aquisphaera insulae]|uniref:hypothetical protein n=1 Tax=Aquisphaera insulae TaxID=2712864 RepID=UPI0013EDAF5E|nr:hypothetical protein [Aquisphaera insulae]